MKHFNKRRSIRFLSTCLLGTLVVFAFVIGVPACGGDSSAPAGDNTPPEPQDPADPPPVREDGVATQIRPGGGLGITVIRAGLPTLLEISAPIVVIGSERKRPPLDPAADATDPTQWIDADGVSFTRYSPYGQAAYDLVPDKEQFALRNAAQPSDFDSVPACEDGQDPYSDYCCRRFDGIPEFDGLDAVVRQQMNQAQCSMDRGGIPWWIPKLIDDVPDVCERKLGTGWRMLTDTDINSMPVDVLTSFTAVVDSFRDFYLNQWSSELALALPGYDPRDTLRLFNPVTYIRTEGVDSSAPILERFKIGNLSLPSDDPDARFMTGYPLITELPNNVLLSQFTDPQNEPGLISGRSGPGVDGSFWDAWSPYYSTIWAPFAGFRDPDGGPSDAEFASFQIPLRCVRESEPPVVEQLAATYNSTCSLAGGEVMCWGSNEGNILGRPSSFGPTTTAQSIPGLPASDAVTQISADHMQACALPADGQPKCWGTLSLDKFGQEAGHLYDAVPILVAETVDASNQITQVAPPSFSGSMPTGLVPLTNVIQVEVGVQHACALRSDGRVLCWGENSYRQQGIGDSQSGDWSYGRFVRSAPGQPLVGVAKISVGNRNTCALMQDNSLRCWGDAKNPQLSSSMVPPEDNGYIKHADSVIAASSFVTLSAGIESVGTIKDISVGNVVICALFDQVVYTGGEAKHDVALCRGISAVLGKGSGSDLIMDGHNSSTPWEGIAEVVAAPFSSHACARGMDSGVRCWGKNNLGQLGQGTTDGTANLTDQNGASEVVTESEAGVFALAGVEHIAVGREHTCAYGQAIGLLCWGSNRFGQLGVGAPDTNPHPSPESVFGF